MIDLTPLEVRKKKGDFRRQLRGYDPAQVDDFLDVVADRLESVVRENLSMTERVTRLEQQVSDYRDRERALTEALVTAQEMREEIRSQTTREVELSKRQALQDAERIRSEAVQEREREDDNLRRLRQRQRQLLQSFRTFLEREISELVVFSKALDMQDEALTEDLPVARRSRSGGSAPDATAQDSQDRPHRPTAAPDALAGLAALAAQPAAPEPPRSEPTRPPVAEPSAAAAPPAVEPRMPEPPATTAPPIVESRSEEPPARPDEWSAPPGGVGTELDPFGDLLSEPTDVARLDDLPAVEDRPEPVGGLGNPFDQTEPPPQSLGPVTEDDLGSLFSSWGAEPEPAAAESETPTEEPAAAAGDELDALMLSEAELFLSDADVLEEPAGEAEDIAALERVDEGDVDSWLLDEELLFGEEEPEQPAASDAPPGDQPVDLSLLPDDDLPSINLDDLGLPPVESTPQQGGFGSSGLTLRPLSSEEEAPEVPRERHDEDDDDMFSTLFGKPR